MGSSTLWLDWRELTDCGGSTDLGLLSTNIIVLVCCHESQVYRNGYCLYRIRCANDMNHLRPRETFPFEHLAWLFFFFLVLLASKSRMFMSLYCGLSSRSSLGLPLCLSKAGSWCAFVVSCLSFPATERDSVGSLLSCAISALRKEP